MSETLIPAQGPVDVLVGRLRTHAEAHEYIANAERRNNRRLKAVRLIDGLAVTPDERHGF